jgi:cobalt-precorrin-5B (C1)-methyltransferase
MPPRSGYTLPVFACAAALAALRWLDEQQVLTHVTVNLIQPPEIVEILVEQVAGLQPGIALAITRSDPGDNLDLTRHTPLWAMVELNPVGQTEAIVLIGGEGIGRHTTDGSAAIYAYARDLITTNLAQHLEDNRVRVTLILPEGKTLAERTSNAAFGVVEGLSLLGTSGIAQPLSSPEQLEQFRSTLQIKAQQVSTLVFCIGENGLDLATQLGIPTQQLIKTANWLGPLLVEAGLQQVRSILLFGYHGKLIKLAGGIFHTHHHVADGRLEILAAHCVNQELPLPQIQALLGCSTVEAALQLLRQGDQAEGSHAVERVYGSIATTIDQRTQAYVQKHSEFAPEIGSILFDRNRQIIVKSAMGSMLFDRCLVNIT